MTNKLKFYNTLSAKKEDFKPLDSLCVTMYVCGPTVYDFAHIGNARPIVVFDVLYRLLQHYFPKVLYARNITDIDDKIINASKENNEPVEALSNRYIKTFQDDMKQLNVLPPSIEPKATENIEPMIDMISRLLENENAYISDQHVLFDVTSMPEYGKLSKRSLEEMMAGARVEVAKYKHNPSDFILWKPSSENQPGWDSPWGRGRPGWHIECSAMIFKHLGKVIDIHGGGMDLVFPHHENEIAQSTCVNQSHDYVRYWMHNGYITVNDEKMSKSLGNFHTVRDILKQYPGEVVRLALLTTHYRKPINWTEDLLQQTQITLDKLYRSLAADEGAPQDTEVPSEFLQALGNDLNTPKAIQYLQKVANTINTDNEKRQENVGKLRAAGNFMGLLEHAPSEWFKWASKDEENISDSDVEELIEKRNHARMTKNFEVSDMIRADLKAKGVVLEDSEGKTTWRRVR
ncbi:MAG: cysteine--tRNA ligase [Pseudomonadota bacterium]